MSVDKMFREKQKRVTSSIWHKYPVGGLQDTFQSTFRLCLTSNHHQEWLDFPLTALVTHYKFFRSGQGWLEAAVIFPALKEKL